MTNEAVIRNGAEKVIDLHGHIVGIAISPDYKALRYFCSETYWYIYTKYLSYYLINE